MALEDARTEVDSAFTRKGQRGLSFENAFGGATSFLRRSYTKDLTGVDLAITGVPFDQAVTHRTGTRFGPRAIREASTLQPYDPPFGWPTNPLEDLNIVDYGDVAFDYARTSEFPDRLTDHIRGILAAGAGTVTLGGDHYITCRSCAPMPKGSAPSQSSSSTRIPTFGPMTTWAGSTTAR